MYIPFDQICMFAMSIGKPIRGILHVGAHECEEKDVYNKCGISDTQIVWVEGNSSKVLQMKEKYPSIRLYEALVDEVQHQVTFYITNNGQSSSILPLETHKIHHPEITVAEEQICQTTTLKKLIEEKFIDVSYLNFWNLDIQGAELQALKGAAEYLNYVDILYCEVNIEHLYKDCALLPELDAFLESKGFERKAIKLTDSGWGDALYVRKN